MRLRRIDALRFGEMEGASLGALGDRLTLVIGPNESGKTTFTHLVRYVLYGFPKGNTKQPQFRPFSGAPRSGRLTFQDDQGAEWTISRTDGTRGGTVELVGPQGSADPETFLKDITRGVPEDVYASVFGFTLAELSSLESLDKIQDHLRASVSGLARNPGEVRGELTAHMDGLFKPAGSKSEAAVTLAALRELRGRIRDLETAAAALALQQGRRDELSEQNEAADARRRESVATAARLRSVVDSILPLNDQIADNESALVEARIAHQRLAERIGETEVDAALAAQADSLALLAVAADEAEAAMRDRDAVQQRLADQQQAVAAALETLPKGWSQERAEALRVDAERLGEIDTRRDALVMREREADVAADALARMQARAQSTRRLATEALGRAGLPVDADTAAVRARIEGLSAAVAQPAPKGRNGVAIAAAALLSFLGAAIAVLSAIAAQWVLAGLGGVAVLAGVALIVYASFARGRAGSGVVDVAGAVESRSALDDALSKLSAAEAADVDADEASAALDRAHASVEAARAEWREWLAASDIGIEDAPDPAAGRSLWGRVRDVQDAVRRMRETANQLDLVMKPVTRFTHRAAEASITHEGGDAWALAALVRQRADDAQRAREQLAARAALEAELREKADVIAAVMATIEAARKRISDELAAADIKGGLTDAQAALEIAVADAEAADAEYREVNATYNKLLGELENQGGDDEMALLRLEEAGLLGRLEQIAQEFVIAAVARELLTRTLSEYERTRQPAVVQGAAPILERITGGNYVRITTPHDRFDMQLLEDDGDSKTTDILSTGAANQLYLALRLSYISYIQSIGKMCPQAPVIMDDVLVNFDDTRQGNVAQEIVRFAQDRQVVLLTCHESTVSTFADAVGSDAYTLLRL